MALSTKTLLVQADTTQKNIKADKAQIPELLITEILPDSKNIDGADAYEFIEVYNNSNREVNLKDYKIYYNYPDKGDSSDVLWVDINEDINVKSGEAIVFWIKNGSNDTLTAADFNNHFNSQLEMNVNLFEVLVLVWLIVVKSS